MEVLSFCAFPDATLLPCFQQNQYGVDSFCRWSLKEHFYQINLQSDKQIMKEKDFYNLGIFLTFWCRNNQSSTQNV